MLKLIASLLLVTPLAFAEFSTKENNSRDIADLMYLPEVGTWFVNLSIDSTKNENTITRTSGSNFSSSTVDSVGAQVTVGTVIKGDMLISLDIPYEFSNEDDTSYGPASTLDGTNTKTESDGLEDLELNFKWRVAEQKKNSVNIDLLIEVSPKTGEAESASTTKEGNSFRGGTNFDVGLEIGKKLESIEFLGGANLAFSGSSKAKSLSTGNEAKSSSFNTFNLYSLVQLKPHEKFFLNTGIVYSTGSDFTVTSGGTNSDYDIDAYLQFAIGAGHRFSGDTTFRLIYTTASLDREIKVSGVTLNQDYDVNSVAGQFQVQF